MSKSSNTHTPNKPKGFGLSAEIQKKILGKYDPCRADECLEWISVVLAHKDPSDADIKKIDDLRACKGAENLTMKDVQDILKDGSILAKVINVLFPGTIKKINKIDNANSPFKKSKENENIANFLKACEEKAGCHKGDLFQSVDLYEANNIPGVIDAIYSLGRKCHHHEDQEMPALGPKEADKNEREFTEEQKEAGKCVIGLQMGTNKLASQAGQNFGKCRNIID